MMTSPATIEDAAEAGHTNRTAARKKAATNAE
jgi:hypothetical protein